MITAMIAVAGFGVVAFVRNASAESARGPSPGSSRDGEVAGRDWKQPVGSRIKVNQVGYLPDLPKRAMVVTASARGRTWTLRDRTGARVASGETRPFGDDQASGDTVEIIDFSSYDVPGTGYTLAVGRQVSYPFDISTEPLRRLRYDALAFHHHQRSTGPADERVACLSGLDCGYALDARGGWYNAGDQGKYVTGAGIAAWQLLNEYERAVAFGDPRALADGTLPIPERGNGVPDILDEARWEVDFLLRMQAPTGRFAGMAHYKIDNDRRGASTAVGTPGVGARYLYPVSTAATLNLAAVAAQAARVWRKFDLRFANRALAAARTAYRTAQANPSVFPDGLDEAEVTDEFYWAAAELYATTGEPRYREDLTGSPLYLGKSYTQRGFDGSAVAAAGDVTLAVVPTGLPAADVATNREALVTSADQFLSQMGTQAYPAPYRPAEGSYERGSNGLVANNGMILALAYDLTGRERYRAGAFETLDYLLGRNPLNQSYVSGYGEQAPTYLYHEPWAPRPGASRPAVPAGALAGGPNTGLRDQVSASLLPACRPQKCYVDDARASSVNGVAVEWNAALAWLANWAAERAVASAAGPVEGARPEAPPSPVASRVTSSAVTLAWPGPAAVADGVIEYDVIQIDHGASTVVASTNTAPGNTAPGNTAPGNTAPALSATVRGLDPATTYTFAVIAKNGAGLRSPSSASIDVTTLPASVDQRPAPPGQPVASYLTASSVVLSWDGSADDHGVVGYEVLRIDGATAAVVASTAWTTATVVDLAEDAWYTFAVVAVDSCGQVSLRSVFVNVKTAGTIWK